jgi:glycosyltransferase involved in cell wall biosynthesis
MKRVSICFAVYQNEESLLELYKRFENNVINKFPNYIFEFIFVNDGSTDFSLDKLIQIRSINSNVKVINFSRNFGQMAAILAGWEYANGDAVINMAADLQDPPEQCVNMIKEWENGNEIVISNRIEHQTSFINKITSRLFYKLVLPQVPKGGFDFVLLDRKPMDVINSFKERNRFYQYDILSVGFNLKFIPYIKEERKHGVSQYNFIKRFNNFYSAFLNVSYYPLRLMTVIGFIFSLSSVLYGTSIIYTYFFNKTPFAGWAPLMLLLLLIGGLIMIMLGVIGEYIWRLLDEVKGRPKYIIKEILQ